MCLPERYTLTIHVITAPSHNVLTLHNSCTSFLACKRGGKMFPATTNNVVHASTRGNIFTTTLQNFLGTSNTWEYVRVSAVSASACISPPRAQNKIPGFFRYSPDWYRTAGIPPPTLPNQKPTNRIQKSKFKAMAKRYHIPAIGGQRRTYVYLRLVRSNGLKNLN